MGEEYKGGWKLNNQGPQIDQLLGMVATANAVANGGVAPGGFGLGKTNGKFLTSNNDLDNIHEGGVYFWGSTDQPTHAPSDIYGARLIVIPFTGNNHYTQIIQGYRTGSYPLITLQRHKADGSWYPANGEWEYVNPPLIAGKEYRTTERFLGKPVYAGFFNVPELSISTSYGTPIAQVAIVDSDGSKITGVQAAASLTLYGNNNMVLYQTPTADSVELYSNRGTLTLLFSNLHDSTTFPTTGWKILAKYIKS